MKKILSKLFNLFSKKKSNNMQNVKITSDINRFVIRGTNWNPVTGQFLNPRVNWFYLLNEHTERIRCFNEQEAIEVSDFLNNAIHTQAQLGNQTSCFINVRNANCVNNECENEVANGIRQNNPNRQLPNKILPNDFGVNSISPYTLNYNIIGYFY